MSEFAFYTSTPESQLRKEIEAGTLQTRMAGKRRRTVITREASSRLK